MNTKDEISDRIKNRKLLDRLTSPERAAMLFRDGMVVAMSGFTPTGYPKIVPPAVAERVKNGETLRFCLETGASTGPEIDETWSKMHMIATRFPYQSDGMLRNAINQGETDYIDIHLSHTAQMINVGILPKPDIVIVEAVAVTEEGCLVPPAAIGNTATFVREAKQVIVELNVRLSPLLYGMADIAYIADPPYRQPIEIMHPSNRIGVPVIPCCPDKISAIVLSDKVDQTRPLKPVDAVSEQISDHIIKFLEAEVKTGRLPEDLPPLQSGVGSIANAVFFGFAKSSFKNLTCYTEVIQDGMIDLIRNGRIKVASSSALSLSPECLQVFEKELPLFKDKIILRPQEISNNPEVIRRLGIIAINSGLEADIYGNVNSTHFLGSRMMNGIGGSGDFARNARLSIFAFPSVAKGGRISSIVPMVSHVDHTEHDVMVIVTEQGLADIRGLSPRLRAETIIEKCAHPEFKGALRSYTMDAACWSGGHTPHNLEKALSWHIKLKKEGSM
jgi:succinyl-CoA:acetate CoA-transferase